MGHERERNEMLETLLQIVLVRFQSECHVEASKIYLGYNYNIVERWEGTGLWKCRIFEPPGYVDS